MDTRTFAGLAVFAVAAAHAGSARAQVATCVETRAPEADLEGLRKLVATEMARHPSHRVVASGCRATVVVELFEAAGTRHLTARAGDEVPVRYTLKDRADLADRLAEAIALVLHNEPAYLTEDVTHLSAMQRLGHALLKGGRNTYRLEVFQAIARTGTGAAFAPGAAFAFTRGSGQWQILARLYAGGGTGGLAGGDRVLRALVGLDAGLTWESSATASAAFYASLTAGFQYLRFQGRVDPAVAASVDSMNQLGATLGARIGVRLFRWHDFDLDLFAAGHLPLFLTRDVDSRLFGEKGAYTPSMQIGVGVGF